MKSGTCCGHELAIASFADARVGHTRRTHTLQRGEKTLCLLGNCLVNLGSGSQVLSVQVVTESEKPLNGSTGLMRRARTCCFTTASDQKSEKFTQLSSAFTTCSRPARSSWVNLATLGLSISSTPTTWPSLKIGTTTSELDAESHAICPGN